MILINIDVLTLSIKNLGKRGDQLERIASFYCYERQESNGSGNSRRGTSFPGKYMSFGTVNQVNNMWGHINDRDCKKNKRTFFTRREWRKTEKMYEK